jgi:hypothetical protein
MFDYTSKDFEILCEISLVAGVFTLTYEEADKYLAL